MFSKLSPVCMPLPVLPSLPRPSPLLPLHSLTPSRLLVVPSIASCSSQPTEAEQCGDEHPKRHKDGKHEAAVVCCIWVWCSGPWLDPVFEICWDLFLRTFLAGLTLLLFFLLFLGLLQARVRLKFWHICPVKMGKESWSKSYAVKLVHKLMYRNTWLLLLQPSLQVLPGLYVFFYHPPVNVLKLSLIFSEMNVEINERRCTPLPFYYKTFPLSNW